MARSSTSRLILDPRFEQRLAAVRSSEPSTVDPALLETMVKSVVSGLSGDLSLVDPQLHREVQSLADYIRTVRRELAGLRPNEISVQHIPMATDELDAVVTATADATGIILGAMEEVEGLAAGLPTEMAAPLGAIVVKVYEACSFQDITGQRITKVVKALRHIESKIDGLLAVFGADRLSDTASAPDAASIDAQASLLNGPQLPAAANSQADIDALMASVD
jgi:chemotaxis protein CheZ